MVEFLTERLGVTIAEFLGEHYQKWSKTCRNIWKWNSSVQQPACTGQAVGHWPKVRKKRKYIRLQRATVYVSWKQHMFNEKLYGNLLRTQSVKIECGLVAVTGEVNKKVLHQLILWDSNCGKRSRHATQEPSTTISNTTPESKRKNWLNLTDIVGKKCPEVFVWGR